MAFCRAQVELNQDSLLPRDRSINTFHFLTPGSVAAAGPDIETNLDALYTTMGSFMSVVLTGTGSIKLYDLEDAEPRVPRFTGGVVFSPGTLAMASEVAACLSFQGPAVSGFPQARRRGRIFLGPLSSTAGEISANEWRPSAAFRGALSGAAAALRDDASLPGLIWSVFSPATAGPPPWTPAALTEAFVTITNGWVDNAFDTQRSRGLAATSRTVF